MNELELHRADYRACKEAGFESPGELLSAYNRAVKANLALRGLITETGNVEIQQRAQKWRIE